MSSKPVFMLQNNHFDQIGRLIQPCLDFCHRHSYEFFDWSLTETFNPDELGVDWSAVPGVIIYGSVGWIRRCASSKLAHWTYYDQLSFAATNWGPSLGHRSLNIDGEVQIVSEVTRRLERGERFHIRPNRDDKAFNGAVYDIVSWTRMQQIRRERNQSLPDPRLECWVSPIKEIEAEYRCWFIDNMLADVSMYRSGGEPSLKRETSDHVCGAATELAAQYLPIGTVVMDIAKTKDGYKVIEFNPINSSGWYAASTEAILTRWCDMLMRKSSR